MAELALEDLTKHFPGGVKAVLGFDLHVADGELAVLVGPSGCGKTTILRMIAGLETPDRGTIRLGGRVVNGLPPAARDVAFVFQRPALYPHLSVRQNLEFGFRMRHRTKAVLRRILPAGRRARHADEAELTGRVAQAAQMLQLEGLLDRRPAQLSGGEQQRVALGKALVRQPALLLLDEPMANLDAHLRSDMRRQLHLLHRGLRATIIYVTHDQTEAMALADRLVVLNHGRALQVGRPLEVYERPRDQFVAGFLGWPPMNFLTGLIDADLRLVVKDAVLPLDAAAAWMKSQRGRTLTVGVRPENVRLLSPDADQRLPLQLTMEVDAIERLGSHALIHLRRGEWRLTALREDACSLTEGETVGVELDASRLHWFDPRNGQVLAPAAAGWRTR